MVKDSQPDGSGIEPAAAPALTAKGAARRRMATLGVGGVVMTVASHNALADMVCKAPSGALSGDLNSHSPKTTCDGRTPEWWMANQHAWPSPVKPDDTFSKYFSSARHPLGSKSCLAVLKGHGTDKDDVAKHIMATYLNVLSRRITFLTEQRVLDMYTRYSRDLEFTPATGADPWNGAELADYLARTQAF